MSVRKKATPKKGRAKAKAAPGRRKEARKPAKKKSAAKPKKPAGKKPARNAAKRPAAAPKKAKAGAARKDAAREKALRLKEKAKEKERALKERALKEREREKQRKDAEREKALQIKEKAKEKERALKEREKQRKDAEREKALKLKEAERQKKEREKERARELKAKEAERVAELKAKEAERVAVLKAKEAEKERIRAEREAERLQKLAERDAARDELKRVKDEERKAKDAEREAYRKAKEVERERIRAEREAVRRALESKVAKASKRAQRGDGIGRGVTTRQYRADTIPNQSGTTRHHEMEERQKLVGVRLPDIAQDPPRPAPVALPTPVVPPPPPPPQLSVEERWAVINERLNGLDEQFQREYRESFEMSWVYHDSALEGVVYTFQELKTAIDPNMSVVADSGLQPVCDEIRRHRQAIEYVRELSEKKRVPINVDTIKKIYCILHPEEGDVKTVKYRKDIPQHRLYFHEYAAPDKIAYKARQVIDWLNGPEPKKLKSPVRIAARVHYDLLRVFPFPQDSGKVSRLLMNVLLMRAGHPPAIIHSTERQRYYEALKGQLPVIVSMVNESIMNALLSIEKKIEDHDASKMRSSSPPKPGEEKPEKPPSAVAAVTTARDNDLDADLYLDSEMEDSDSESDSDSDSDSSDD
ncbi:MAG: Fic family protein [Pseudomonadota bacterium]